VLQRFIFAGRQGSTIVCCFLARRSSFYNSVDEPAPERPLITVMISLESGLSAELVFNSFSPSA